MHATEEAVDSTFSDARSQAIGHQRILKRRLPMFLSAFWMAQRACVLRRKRRECSPAKRVDAFSRVPQRSRLRMTISQGQFAVQSSREGSLRTWASFALAASIFMWPATALTV